MTLLLWCILAPALLLCGLKLSLVERLWEILPAALLVSLTPVVLYPFAVRASLLEVEQLLRSDATLCTFSTLLALEAILSLLLVAAVMLVHADSTSATREKLLVGTSMYTVVLTSVLVSFLISTFLQGQWFRGLTLLSLVGVLLWPWLPYRFQKIAAARRRKNTKNTLITRLVTPFWALLSPAGVAAIAGVHMHFLHTATGVDLWGLTLSYSAGLFVGLCVVALLLRLVIRQWRLRLDGVMLLAFLLLMTAMFIPQLFSNTPPPASAIQVNGPATLAFALLTSLFVAGRVLYSKQRSSARH